METKDNLKIIGNLSLATHTRVNVIKATFGLGSMERTMKFILGMFDLIDEDEKKKYIDNCNSKKLEETETYKVEELK